MALLVGVGLRPSPLSGHHALDHWGERVDLDLLAGPASRNTLLFVFAVDDADRVEGVGREFLFARTATCSPAASADAAMLLVRALVDPTRTPQPSRRAVTARRSISTASCLAWSACHVVRAGVAATRPGGCHSQGWPATRWCNARRPEPVSPKPWAPRADVVVVDDEGEMTHPRADRRPPSRRPRYSSPSGRRSPFTQTGSTREIGTPLLILADPHRNSDVTATERYRAERVLEPHRFAGVVATRQYGGHVGAVPAVVTGRRGRSSAEGAPDTGSPSRSGRAVEIVYVNWS